VTEPEAGWTEFDRDFIAFLQTAYAEGFAPRYRYLSAVEAKFSDRSAFLVFRGSRNGWEPFLENGGASVKLGPCFGLEGPICMCVRPPFRDAAHFVLGWLRGRSLDSILQEFEFVGGRPEGISRRTTDREPDR
jgi:hypothetical protein